LNSIKNVVPTPGASSLTTGGLQLHQALDLPKGSVFVRLAAFDNRGGPAQQECLCESLQLVRLPVPRTRLPTDCPPNDREWRGLQFLQVFPEWRWQRRSDLGTVRQPESAVSVRERRRAAGTIPPHCDNKNCMEPWSLPKALPISCNDSPAFQRRHMSGLCCAETLSRFPCVINTTFRKMIHNRWCCIDRLRPPGLSGNFLFLQSSEEILSRTTRPFCWRYV